MMRVLKNIVNKTIEREFRNCECRFRDDLKKNEELNHEYEVYTSKVENLRVKLQEVLPNEYHGLLDELEDSMSMVNVIESEVSFKEGLILGVTELKYFNEVGIEITCI